VRAQLSREAFQYLISGVFLDPFGPLRVPVGGQYLRAPLALDGGPSFVRILTECHWNVYRTRTLRR
jgi:hypothetical protein